MLLKIVGAVVISTLLLAGCGNKDEVPEPEAPIPSGVAGTVRVRINYDMNLPSMIDRYAEAMILPQGANSEAAVGSASISDAGHTKGVPNQQSIKVSAQNLDPESPYTLAVAIYDSAEKAIQLYRGVCEPADCMVITQGKPTDMNVTLEPVTDEETIYANSVPESIRLQCRVQPTTEECGQKKDRVYYDEQVNTCKRFNFTGCGDIQPFSSMSLCQQGCIR